MFIMQFSYGAVECSALRKKLNIKDRCLFGVEIIISKTDLRPSGGYQDLSLLCSTMETNLILRTSQAIGQTSYLVCSQEVPGSVLDQEAYYLN